VTPVHADEVDGAVSRHLGGSPECLSEEGTEGLVRHLARGHGELAVAPLRVGVAANANIVGRVEEGGVDLSALANDPLQKLEIAAVAAADPMIAKAPDVPRPCTWMGGDGRDHVVVGILVAAQQQIEFTGREAGDRKIHVEIE
jgi:hypothetical protein